MEEGFISSGEEEYVQLMDFYLREVELLDGRRFEDWLGCLTDDIVYALPVRSSLGRTGGEPFGDARTGFYDEDMATLTARVAFLQKPGAWGEEPASRARRFITNLRVRKTADGEYETTVNLLLTVLREGSVVPDIVVGERRDKVRKDGGEFKISRRHVLVDNGSLPGRALSVPV